LLALKPRAKTVEVEYVATGQFFWGSIRPFNIDRHFFTGFERPRQNHFFTAYYASVIAHCSHLLFCCVWVSLIHVARSCLVTVERPKPSDEGTTSNVDIPKDVKRYAIKGHDDDEKHKICRQLEEI
jgi:hypothetical protein